MFRPFPRLLIPCALACLLLSPGVSGQSDDQLRRQIANLVQDVAILNKQVGSLRLEIEQLSRRNTALESQLAATRAAQGSAGDSMRMVDARIADLRAELLRADAKNRSEILDSVTKQIDKLVDQVEAQLKRIASAVQGRPNPQPVPSFSDDYPQTGVEYQVQPGDTLSGIASRFNSRIKWIQDANRIVDVDRDLRAGQTILVPVEQN